jgi:hypothetical protein
MILSGIGRYVLAAGVAIIIEGLSNGAPNKRPNIIFFINDDHKRGQPGMALTERGQPGMALT